MGEFDHYQKIAKKRKFYGKMVRKKSNKDHK